MKRGFSLIEVMIASSMLLVGIAGIVFGTQIATQQHAHDRKVSVALKAYAKFATSADKGAVRDLSQLEDH
jgi:prepilin-type N-terminal cleavage/methylation domain-containing protein